MALAVCADCEEGQGSGVGAVIGQCFCRVLDFSAALAGGGGGGVGLGIRLFAFGGAYWPLATAHSDPLWVRTCLGCVNGAHAGGTKITKICTPNSCKDIDSV